MCGNRLVLYSHVLLGAHHNLRPQLLVDRGLIHMVHFVILNFETISLNWLMFLKASTVYRYLFYNVSRISPNNKLCQLRSILSTLSLILSFSILDYLFSVTSLFVLLLNSVSFLSISVTFTWTSSHSIFVSCTEFLRHPRFSFTDLICITI